jgi:hypothetical protein
MAHYLFNFTNPEAEEPALREQATAFLRVEMWGVGAGELHGDELAPGDLTLIYLGPPERTFIGRAELASAVRDWKPSEAQVYPGDSTSGVLLAEVEEWDPPVPMRTVVPRIDPTGSNPFVQANARDGFRLCVVRITDHEYETVLRLRAEGCPRFDFG